MTANLTLSTIETHTKLAAELAQQIRGQSDFEPMLHLVMPDEKVMIVALAVEGAGRSIAFAARQAILQIQPAHAVLLIEGWTHRKDLSHDDPDYRAVMAGALRPAQLPPHKRGEQLCAIGESATGEEAYSLRYIESDDSFTTLIDSWAIPPEEAAGTGINTHFHPLFVAEDMLRRLPADSRAEMLELVGSEARLLDLARQAAATFLRAGGDPSDFDRQSAEFVRLAQEQIGWRKGKRNG